VQLRARFAVVCAAVLSAQRSEQVDVHFTLQPPSRATV
jgi:hypothetical protein